ncbi:hypothetical protein B7494_g4109 [Chlorociboria aeruginascens]|nr:hypothetical protein B7494_g4109 [Chlorociboria aeruginascens]
MNMKSKQPRGKHPHYIPMDQRAPSTVVPLYERADLPEEIKSRLFTIENIVSRGSGTLADSRWAAPQELNPYNNLKMASDPIAKPTNGDGNGYHSSPQFTASLKDAPQKPGTSGLQDSAHAPDYVPPHLRDLPISTNPKHEDIQTQDNVSILTSTTSTASPSNVGISGGGVALWRSSAHLTTSITSTPHKQENGGDLSPSPAVQPFRTTLAASQPRLDNNAFLKFIKKVHSSTPRQALVPNVTDTKKLTENNSAGQQPKVNISQQLVPQNQLDGDQHPCRKQDPHSAPNPSNGGVSGHNSVKCETASVKEEFSQSSNLEAVNTIAAPADSLKWKLSPSPGPLTQGALATSSDYAPHQEWSITDIFEDRVSDTGIDNSSKEVVRANQGRTPNEEFLDWDGSRLPPPADWENDRPIFDGSFIPEYIREWIKKISSDMTVLEMTPRVKEEFTKGQILVNNGVLTHNKVFDAYPGSFHDPEDLENYDKRMFQTAQTDLLNFRHRVEKRQKQKEQQAKMDAAHYHELASREPEPNPFAPNIDIYLRPATEKDAKGIAEVYNYYVNYSDVPEDQVSVVDEDIRQLILIAKDEKLPFIVAIKGRIPAQKNTTKNSGDQAKKFILPQFESVAGFAFAESRNYGFTGKRTGRNRFTVALHLYTHHQLLGNGIGRCLLDCLLQTLSGSYGGNGGYEWNNTENDPVYNSGGVSFKRQLLFEFPTYKDDPNYPKMKRFMLKFFFQEEARLIQIGKASCAEGRGAAKFLDSVIFSREATSKEEFGPFT